MSATATCASRELPVIKPFDSALGAEITNLDLGKPLSEAQFAVVVGMDIADGIKLLAQLEAHTTQDKFVYRHKWQVNDVLMWDNRSTLHCVTPYDAAREKRAVHRVVVKGDKPF